jgi:hypothetical protein
MKSVPVASGALLWGRALVLSSVGLLGGAVAHVQADGLLPGARVLVALAVVGTLAAAPLLRHEVSTLRLVVLLVAGQAAVHTVLAVTAGHRGDPVSAPRPTPVVPVAPSPSADGRHGSYFDVAYAPQVGSHHGGLSVPAPLVHAFTDMSAHPVMAAAHLLAAAACGWYLAQGERALWLLVTATARGWSALVSPVRWSWTVASLPVRRPALALVTVVPRPHPPVLARSVSRRGPPLAA